MDKERRYIASKNIEGHPFKKNGNVVRDERGEIVPQTYTSFQFADRLFDLSKKISLSTATQVIEYALTAADVEKINTWVTKSDGTKDPKWYWLALRGKGFTASNIYYDTILNTTNLLE